MSDQDQIKPIAPAHDTSVLLDAQLLDSQRTVLNELAARLDGYRQRAYEACRARRAERDASRTWRRQDQQDTDECDRRRPRSREDVPWDPLEAQRQNQVLMLNGGRGTGKTSLLITALDSWRKGGAPWSVLALDPVDFDPMPRGMSPFSWVVLSLRKLVDWIEAHDPEFPARRWAPGANQMAESSLDELWRTFFRRAEMGWSAPVKQSDVEDFIEASEQKQRGWLKLQASWRALIDGLIRRLERTGQLQPSGIILQPIDDLDLAPRHTRALLLALRHLHHERVVFLLTGDVEHLLRVVELRQFETENVDGITDDVQQATWERTSLLARDLVNKVIPQAHRLEVRSLSPLAALEFAARYSGHVEEDADGHPVATVGAYLVAALSEQRLDAADRQRPLADRILNRFQRLENDEDTSVGFRVRDVVQALERYPFSDDGGRSFAELMRTARLADGTDALDFERFAKGPLEIRPGERIQLSGAFHTDDFRVGVAGETENLNPILETALQIPRLRPGPRVWNRVSEMSPLAGSIIQLPPRQSLLIGWPGFALHDLDDAYQRVGQLAVLDEWFELEFKDSLPGPDRLLLAWLVCHWAWVSGNPEPFDIEPSYAVVLSELVLNAEENDVWLRDWLVEQLPVLSAPEYRFTPLTISWLLGAARQLCPSADAWQALVDRWRARRVQWLDDASDDRVDAAAFVTQIDRENARHPWRHVSAIGQLSFMTVDELRYLIGREDVAKALKRHFEAGIQPLKTIESLESVEGVGPGSIEKLIAWANALN